ncbi:MAG TPA: HD domain-containing protein [Steroidobacteraceae bacterium]|nr:HD domain-containing protein [Steroidobacteraceae bacterium]
MSVADEIFAVFGRRGAQAYFGERVSITEHSLQAAHAAQVEGAPPSLVVAALLHDIGHLLEDVPDDIAEWTVDAQHEEIGSRWLATRFAPAVCQPVGLHVPAKRYLCAIDARYVAQLSPASVRTLELQGGPMSAPEVAAFENEPFFRDAVRVRHWDDLGKRVGLTTAHLTEYRTLLESLGNR